MVQLRRFVMKIQFLLARPRSRKSKDEDRFRSFGRLLVHDPWRRHCQVPLGHRVRMVWRMWVCQSDRSVSCANRIFSSPRQAKVQPRIRPQITPDWPPIQGFWKASDRGWQRLGCSVVRDFLRCRNYICGEARPGSVESLPVSRYISLLYVHIWVFGIR